MTKDQFIEKANLVHNNRYNYDKIPNTLKYKDKVSIICPEHGEFKQTVGNHLFGANCPVCGTIKRNKIYNKEEFIAKSKKIHGDKYDYSQVNYVDSKTKVYIIDKENGGFWQTPNSHLSGHGCLESLLNKQKKFISRSEIKHHHKYDYSRVEYKGVDIPVTIICPEHGEFKQTPYNHLLGHGCPSCGGTKKITTEEFIKRAREIHGDKYDYSKTEYINNTTKICIICPKHGEFWQTPNKHLSGHGCHKCGRKIVAEKQLLTNEQFINQAKLIHGDKYDYSKVVYTGYEEYVTIICPEHGEFKQTPDSHLHSGGCPKCGSTLSKNEDELYNYIQNIVGINNVEQRNRSILGNKEIDIYIPKLKIGIEYNGLYWHSERNPRMDKNYHLNKTLLCELNGIRLIQIFEDEYVKHKDVVLNKISHLLKYDMNKPKIMGRKCSIKCITKTESEIFLDKYHIQGFVRGTIHLGAYYNDELIAVMSFTKEKCNYNNWELTRFASNYNYVCQGVGGKLFKYFIRNYQPEQIKSFADRRWCIVGNNIYECLGFKFEKFTKPDYYYYNENIDKYNRIHKFNFRKKILSKKYGLDITKTETTMADELDYVKIWNCGLIKYVWKK